MNDTCQQLEVALVGSLLVSPEKIVDVVDRVSPADFTNERLMAVYVSIIDEYRKRNPINIVTISATMPGNSIMLSSLLSDAYPPGVIKFADDIAHRAKTRRVRTGLEAALKNVSHDEMLKQIIDLYHHEMSAGKKDPSIKSVMSRVSSKISNNKNNGEVGFSFGFNLHRDIYYRYFPGHIITMGGFTSVGKTAVMVQKICNLMTSGEGASILLISTEMSEEQIVARIISNFTGIHSMRILSANFHDAEEEDRVNEVKNTLKEANLKIYDEIYELSDIETAFRRAEMQGGVNVGFIDYVQNCRNPEAKSEYQEQATMAKRFQSLAKEVEAAIVCLSQVSNDVGRGNTDQLELKGAGEWAAVSDLGVMLYRDKTEKHKLLYEIKKNRHGALGECGLSFENVYTSLREFSLHKKNEWK